MPAQSAHAAAAPTAVAPDGIAIHTFALPAAAFMGIAEGRIPPGRYAIHCHLSLEQYTYVLYGRVSAITGSADHPEGRPVDLGPGDLLLTQPGESLQFINAHDDECRVLFICAPPYPPDDGDTRLLDAHGPPQRHETAAAIERIETIRALFNETIDRRLAALRG